MKSISRILYEAQLTMHHRLISAAGQSTLKKPIIQPKDQVVSHPQQIIKSGTTIPNQKVAWNSKTM